MPALTMEEVERQLFTAKSWKAPGEDGTRLVKYMMEAVIDEGGGPQCTS
jgi:hypothetical protein